MVPRPGNNEASASSLAVMMSLRALFTSIAIFSLLAGCGSPANAPVPAAPPLAARPDVIITFDGEHHTCVVALSNESQGSAVPCGDVVPFLRDELRVPSGSVYDIPAFPDSGGSEMKRVADSLQAAGYRFIGGPHAAIRAP
jgi:hypothetical protein